MTGIFNSVKNFLQYRFSPKSYYDGLIITNEDQFNEYLEIIDIGSSDSTDADSSLVLEELRDKIFNLVCSIMIKQRDSFLIKVQQDVNLKSLIRIRILFFFYIFAINIFIFYFVPNEVGEKEPFLKALWSSFIFTIFETLYIIVIDAIFYRILYKRIKTRLDKYCYDIYDEDIKEYYETRGKNVFGENFLSDYSEHDNNCSIQLFRDKLSMQLNSVCVLKPLIVHEDEIVMSIGFMGTLTDKKLKFTILNKIVDNLNTEFLLLKEANIDKKVTLEIITRGIDFELLHFLLGYKGFKKDKETTSDFRFYKGFNKIRLVKN